MKLKYSIGLFALAILYISILSVGYQLSYRHMTSKAEQKLALAQAEQPLEIITTKGTAIQNEGYYLRELHGYVAVYLSDKTTLYEFTEILMDKLPETLQSEIKSGKFVQTAEELYQFLQNYSS